MPNSRNLNWTSFAAAVNLAANHGVASRAETRYQFSEEEAKAFFALFDFRAGGKASILAFTRGIPAKKVANVKDLEDALEEYARILGRLGVTSFAQGVLETRRSFKELALSSVPARDFAVASELVDHVLSKPVTVSADQFLANHVYGDPPVPLVERFKAAMQLRMDDPYVATTLTNYAATMAVAAVAAAAATSIDGGGSGGDGGGSRRARGARGGSKKRAAEGQELSVPPKKIAGAADEDVAYRTAFNMRTAQLGLLKGHDVCRYWLEGKGQCAGRDGQNCVASIGKKNHALPATLPESKHAALLAHFKSFNPPRLPPAT